MTIDEGVIKYNSDWTVTPAIDSAVAAAIDEWRRPLFDAALIGEYASDGIGYGNLSIRARASGQFYISGTQTGHLAATDGRHYSLVRDYSIAENRVACEGPAQASSESLTHAAIYELDTGIGAVVHVHSATLWQRLKNQLPTSDPQVAYGTPAMAGEFKRLYQDGGFADTGIAVMGGHEEGLVSFGRTLQQAAQRFLEMDSAA